MNEKIKQPDRSDPSSATPEATIRTFVRLLEEDAAYVGGAKLLQIPDVVYGRILSTLRSLGCENCDGGNDAAPHGECCPLTVARLKSKLAALRHEGETLRQERDEARAWARDAAVQLSLCGDSIRALESQLSALTAAQEQQQTQMLSRAADPSDAVGRQDLRGVPTEDAPRVKGVYIGAPACFALEEAIRPVCEAFGCYQGEGIRGCYVVGSALQRPDWRDVDIRLMLDDASFAEVFPNAGEHWEHDARWLVLTVAISERLSKLTGLPIDFQFQPMTHANARHKGPRNAIGIRIAKASQ